MSTTTSCADVMATLFARLRAHPPQRRGIINVQATGPGGGNFVVMFGKFPYAGPGQASDPGLTLTLAAPDLVAICLGQTNALLAYAMRKVRVEGDASLLRELQALL
jgi:hypothetical protein